MGKLEDLYHVSKHPNPNSGIDQPVIARQCQHIQKYIICQNISRLVILTGRAPAFMFGLMLDAMATKQNWSYYALKINEVTIGTHSDNHDDFNIYGQANSDNFDARTVYE